MLSCWFPAKNHLRRRFAVTSHQSTRSNEGKFLWITENSQKMSWRIYVKCHLFGMGSQSQSDSSQLTTLIVSFVSRRVVYWSYCKRTKFMIARTRSQLWCRNLNLYFVVFNLHLQNLTREEIVCSWNIIYRYFSWAFCLDRHLKNLLTKYVLILPNERNSSRVRGDTTCPLEREVRGGGGGREKEKTGNRTRWWYLFQSNTPYFLE